MNFYQQTRGKRWRGGFGRPEHGAFRGGRRGRGGRSSENNLLESPNYESDAFSKNVYNEDYSLFLKQKYNDVSYNQRFRKDIEITSVDDVIKELVWKQNPNIKDLDNKIYDELEKFSKMIDFLKNNDFDQTQKVHIFQEVAKTFSLKQLVNSTNSNRKASIYAIFFDDNDFKLTDYLEATVIEILTENANIIVIFPILNLFRELIKISPRNAEMLNANITLLRNISNQYPNVKKEVEELIEYSETRKQIEINSLESSTSPTPQDLFFADKTIDNHKRKIYHNFTEYKKSMIDLSQKKIFIFHLEKI